MLESTAVVIFLSNSSVFVSGLIREESPKDVFSCAESIRVRLRHTPANLVPVVEVRDVGCGRF